MLLQCIVPGGIFESLRAFSFSCFESCIICSAYLVSVSSRSCRSFMGLCSFVSGCFRGSLKPSSVWGSRRVYRCTGKSCMGNILIIIRTLVPVLGAAAVCPGIKYQFEFWFEHQNTLNIPGVGGMIWYDMISCTSKTNVSAPLPTNVQTYFLGMREKEARTPRDASLDYAKISTRYFPRLSFSTPVVSGKFRSETRPIRVCLFLYMVYGKCY